MIVRGLFLFSALGMVLLTGCEAEVVKVPPRVQNVSLPDSPPQAGTRSVARQVPDKQFNPESMDVKIGDETALAALIEKHKGQIVFVDYWATWCEPCVEFFPHTVETFEKYRDQGLAVISVSFDSADDETAVRRFLAQHQADFENLIRSYDSGSEAYGKFKIKAVPWFRLYDRQGQLRAEWTKEPKPTEVDAKIRELLAEK